MDRGGLVGADGPTHHGVYDLTYMRMIPNLALLAPRDEEELRHMLASALQADQPVALRWPRGPGIGAVATGPPTPLPWGRSELMREGGDDLLLVAAGPLVFAALEAADRLAAKGVGVTVINARFIKPLDEELLLSRIAATDALVTIEENALCGGFGSALLELCEQRGLRPRVRRLGIPDRFIPHGRASRLRAECGLDADGIVGAYHQLAKKGRLLSLA
jgi:1-deoxy-D-xylulose-5-phosphate synthase